MLKFTIQYVDGDWPYAYQPDEIHHFKTVEEAQNYCDTNSIRRDRFNIVEIDGVPYHKWIKENETV